LADVVIVGGGAIGCATAYFLARAGARVTLVERGELAGEATGAAAGMLAALSDEGGERGPAFQRLCLDSLRLYHDLLPQLAETGIDLRYRRSGVLHVALDDREAVKLRRRYEAQRRLAPALRWLEAGEMAALEPEVSPRATAGMLSPEEHYLDPQRLALALAAAARDLGASVRTDAAPRGFSGRGGALTALDIAGARLRADAFVIAAGPWTSALARRLGSFVPVRPVRGQMLSLAGPAEPLRHVVWGEGAYLVPRENGQTFVGATVEDVGFRKRTTKRGIGTLRRGAVGLVPGLRLAKVTSAWAGLRPGSPDGLPVIGLLPGYKNVWVATGHFRNGILLAPVTGLLVSQSLQAGRPVPALRPFSPSRFAG
jgi:glycine oxidase